MPKKIPPIIREIQNYKPPGVNYTFQKNVSFSQYSMWKSCPKHWSLNYREGYKKYSPSIHTVFGTAMHETLQHYIKVLYEESGAAADREDIEGIFKENLRLTYAKEYKSNKKVHFSSSLELREFYEDGLKIIDFIKKRRGQYFSKRGWFLAGIETPITQSPNPKFPNILYIGYLDLVLYHEPTNTFKIIDIKTSTKGWNDYNKKDEGKQFQLILYKEFFAKQFGIPKESIDIEFFIVKRKIYEDCDFPQKRVQEFAPASGKVKTNKATKALNEFIEKCFIGKEYTEDEMLPNPSKFNCNFCPFKNEKSLCKVGVNS